VLVLYLRLDLLQLSPGNSIIVDSELLTGPKPQGDQILVHLATDLEN